MTRGVAALLAAVWLATGCAAWRPASMSPDTPADAAALRLEIEAPDDLKSLLQRHLDLARLAALPADDSLDEAEWGRLVGAAPGQARDLAQTEGYFAAQVQVQRLPADAGGPARLRMVVTPGPRASVERFQLFTEGELDQKVAAGDPASSALLAELRQQWTLPSGQPWRNAAWADAKAALLAGLRAAGYASATLSGSAADVDAARARVALAVVVDSGPLYHAGELKVQGLQHHDASMVKHLAGFGPGTPLTEALLLDYQDRLVKTGLFDRVTVGFEPDPDQAATTPVQVQLNEQLLQQATLGAGYSANTGPRVTLEHRHRRAFGWPVVAYNKLEWGRDRQSWEGELKTHPGEGYWRNLVGGQIERLKSKDDIVSSRRLRLGRAQDSERVERLYFVEVDLETTSTASGKVRSQAYSLNHHLVVRRLDSVVLPTRGWTLSLQGAIGQADSDVADRGGFARLYGRGTAYWPLGASWYGQARLELGQVFRGDSVRVPDSLAFRAGGDESVRGYAYRSLGPVVAGVVTSGRVLGTASVELARPISTRLPSVWGAAFIDAGRAADHWGDLKPALGYGLGLRWRSPVGPLKLDYAWGDEVGRGRLHFSVGIAF